LEKRGLLERDAENTWTEWTPEQGEDDVLTQLHGHSVSYRIATGRPQQGCKVFTLQTLARTGG